MTTWTAIIVNYNGAAFLDACLIALGETRHPPREIILVDNASTDESLQDLYGYPHVDVIALDHNRGYAGGANIGLRRVEDPLAVIMNPDIEVDRDFGTALSTAFEDDRVGAVSGLLLYPDGRTIQHAGGVLSRPHLFTDHRGRGKALSDEFQRVFEPDFLTGAALGIRMDAVRQVSGFDERFVPAYYEDVDLCVRLREAGWKLRYDPALRALHHEGVTLERSDDYYVFLHRNRLRYAMKHLSDEEWNRDFVPAEFERLRHEIETASDENWATVAGIEALASVMRTFDAPDLPPLASAPEGFPSGPSADDLADLHEHRSVSGQLRRSRLPGLNLLRRFIMSLGPRQYVDDALARQRAFNDAVVLALERQRDLNREQTALALLHAMTALGVMRTLASGDELPDDRDDDVATEIDPARPDHSGEKRDEQSER